MVARSLGAGSTASLRGIWWSCACRRRESREERLARTARQDRLWRKAVLFLIRVVKKERLWWAGAVALRFLTERRNALNEEIERELRLQDGEQ